MQEKSSSGAEPVDVSQYVDAQHGRPGATGTPRAPPKLGLNRGGVRSTYKLSDLQNGAR